MCNRQVAMQSTITTLLSRAECQTNGVFRFICSGRFHSSVQIFSILLWISSLTVVAQVTRYKLLLWVYIDWFNTLLVDVTSSRGNLWHTVCLTYFKIFQNILLTIHLWYCYLNTVFSLKRIKSTLTLKVLYI